MSKNKIVVFDSGVGGLTILQALKNRLIEAEYIYASDKEHFPYGTKPDETVKNLASDFCQKLYQAHQPDILVVACNTASTLALEEIRQKVPCPVVGVVPAIKPAAKISQTKLIGLLATPATVKRAYIDRLASEFASDCTLIRVGSSQLVQIAEDKVAGKSVSLNIIADEIAPLFEANVDVIVLGCTHFPHLIEEFKTVAPRPVVWLDSSEAIANRVISLLEVKIRA